MMIRFDVDHHCLRFSLAWKRSRVLLLENQRVNNTSSIENTRICTTGTFKTKLALKPTTGKIVIIASSSVKRSQN